MPLLCHLLRTQDTRAKPALGPATATPTMLATASQPALRNVVARFRRRISVSMVLLSPRCWRGKRAPRIKPSATGPYFGGMTCWLGPFARTSVFDTSSWRLGGCVGNRHPGGGPGARISYAPEDVPPVRPGQPPAHAALAARLGRPGLRLR